MDRMRRVYWEKTERKRETTVTHKGKYVKGKHVRVRADFSMEKNLKATRA